jgi:hypothetical protein
MTRRRLHPTRSLVAIAVLLGAVLWAPEARARVEITLDAGSLNELLAAMAPETVPVNLIGNRAVTLRIEDFRITGFDPAGGGQLGHVLTSVRLRIPELGVDTPLQPRLSLQVRDQDGDKVAYFRFEKVPITLPLTGTLDIAPLLPLLPLPTDTSWTVNAQRGPVQVRTRLVEAQMGARNLRLTFELEVRPLP